MTSELQAVGTAASTAIQTWARNNDTTKARAEEREKNIGWIKRLFTAWRVSHSLADCAVVFVGKDADTACKKLIKRVGLVLGLSEVAILVAAKSLLTTKLLLAVPVIGSMSMLLYEYPFTRIGRAPMH